MKNHIFCEDGKELEKAKIKYAKGKIYNGSKIIVTKVARKIWPS